MNDNKFDFIDNLDEWKKVIIDAYFKRNGLIKHQIDSYNDFIDNKINDIINGFNPIVMRYDYNQEDDNYLYEIIINVTNFIMSKPDNFRNNS